MEVELTESHANDTSMWIASMDAVVSRWFTTYEAARASLDAEGGYLFPYGTQFFVTLAEGVRELGLDPVDPDWARIGWDWVRPVDSQAWRRLRDKRELAT